MEVLGEILITVTQSKPVGESTDKRSRMIPLTLESILEGILDEEMTSSSGTSSTSPVLGSSSMSNVDGSSSPMSSGSPPQGETFSVVLDHHDIRASHSEPTFIAILT